MQGRKRVLNLVSRKSITIFLILVLILSLSLTSCSQKEVILSFKSSVVSQEFIVRSMNVSDLVQVTFQSGHTIFVSQEEAFQFVIGSRYYVEVTGQGDLVSVKQID